MFARLMQLFGAIGVALLVPTFAAAQPARVVVARSDSPAATFCARPGNGNVFTVLPDKADLFAGDMIVSLPGGTLSSKSGAITLKSLADFNAKSSLPILETALSLAESNEADLDLTLDRGRVDITNTKASGSATVRVRFWGESWKIVLDSPQSRVAVELCGRWMAGSRFKPAEPDSDPKKLPCPAASLVFLVLNGSASVNVGTTSLGMKAPPGPAELVWNSLLGVRLQAQKLEKVPEWADRDTVLSADGKKVAAACEKFRMARAADPAKALDTFLTSSDPVELRVALVALGTLDDVDRLGKTLVAKTAEEWDYGITVLRHWLGHCPGQDQRLYKMLTSRGGYTANEAQVIMQLLFGFSPEDAAAPETYEVLIDYLAHEKPGIRNLAVWHLARLVPQAKSIPFKPGGTAEDVEEWLAAWKKLIPGGQLPPRTKKE